MLKLINNQYNLLYKSMMEKKLKKPSSIKNVVEMLFYKGSLEGS